MTEIFHNEAYAVNCTPGGICLSVRGCHAWAGEGPSFFVPAARLMIGRIITIMGDLARRAMNKVRQVCWRKGHLQGRFIIPGAAGTGRLVSRRL